TTPQSSRPEARSRGLPALRYALRLVERRVDLGDLLGLARLGGRVLLAVVGRAAEVEPEPRQVDAAAVGADLLERREQRLALVRLARDDVRRPHLDRPVAL